MMLRAEPMAWVDIVLDKPTAPSMCEVIAATEVFEPDRARDPEFGDWNEVSSAGAVVRELHARIRSYGPYLPDPDMNDTTAAERAAQFPALAGELDGRVNAWLEAAKPEIERLAAVEQERAALYDLRQAVSLLPSSMDLELWQSGETARRSCAPVIMCGHPGDVAAFLDCAGDARLQGHFPHEAGLAVVRGLVGPGELEGMSRQGRQYGLRVLDIPTWLNGSPGECVEQISGRIAELDRESRGIRDHLASLSTDNRMAGTRWLIERRDWLENVLEQAHQGRNFVHIGGWVPRHRYEELVTALKRAGKPFLIRLDDGQSHGSSPTMLNNPSWVRNFELLVTGFGTPDINEVDPSMVLAVVTPLMFGYMFGDVGQGLLLTLAGWLLGRRLPWIRLLVPAGISAVAFGFLYGSVFSMEGWIPALWLHPMEEPLIVLGAPLIFGALMMLLSLVFGCVEARWRAKTRQWLASNVPLICCYLAPLVWLASPRLGAALLGVAFAALLFLPGAERRAFTRRVSRLPGAFLELLEQWVQLMINTLSFARLGAFSLAHAGLSMALVSLSEIPDSAAGAVAVLVVGNLVITALEGLVVSIQTTRLVMFEFFRRFFEGTGRRFQPLTLGGHPGGGEGT